jgi:transglutaminase-like putative cysteine protease
VQRVESTRIETDLPQRIVVDPVYGNRFLYIETDAGPTESQTIGLTFNIRRDECRAGSPDAPRLIPTAAGELARLLKPDRFVPTDGVIAARSAQVVDGVDGEPLDKARLLYEDVLRTMNYDRTGVGWGREDAVYACEVGAGNCTDFHSLFIGLARAAEIPARFVIGFPLPAEKKEGAISGYHCWAEFFDERLGWVPLDASEAWKHPEMKDLLFAGLDANRVEFTIGRDIPLIPEEKAGNVRLNYSIYPYVVVDGRPHDGIVTSFRFRDAAS